MHLFLSWLSGVEDITSQLLRVYDTKFFYMFREVFFTSITKKKHIGRLRRSWFYSVRPRQGHLETRYPIANSDTNWAPDPATYWVFKTPQNPIEASSQTELINNRITNH
jgi:hypothetical protein